MATKEELTNLTETMVHMANARAEWLASKEDTDDDVELAVDFEEAAMKAMGEARVVARDILRDANEGGTVMEPDAAAGISRYFGMRRQVLTALSKKDGDDATT